jgi:hypothetical protein
MVTAKSVTDKVAGDRSLFERITMYIPFYRGYRARHLRREVDREIRQAISRMIKDTKVELGYVHREILEAGDMTVGRKVERIRNKVDTYNTKVEKAASGYSPLWAAVKKEEEELDAVVEFDAQILESADDLRKSVTEMRDSLGNEGLGKMVNDLERKVDIQIEAYEQREFVLKGLAKEE